MKIGIDISQLAYKNTGVANYLRNFVNSLIKEDSKNEYILFFSSFRRSFDELDIDFAAGENIKIKQLKFPPTALNILWNNLHIAPIEMFVGDIDVFITSDWTEPPAKHAKKGTIIYDMLISKYPEEMHKKIINVQNKKLDWVKKESDFIFTISESSKKDIEKILNIESNKIKVVYPGL